MNAYASMAIPESVTKVGTPFLIGQHDRLTIEGRPYRLVSNSGSNALLRPEAGDGLTEQFPSGVLSQLSAHGKIRHEVDFYLPAGMRVADQPTHAQYSLALLSAMHGQRVKVRYALVQGVEEMAAEGLIGINDKDIGLHIDEIAERATAYLKDTASGKDMADDQERRDGQTPRKRKSGKTTEAVIPPHASTLRKSVVGFRKHGMAHLVDSLACSGNRSSFFRPEEHALLMETIINSYLTLERKTIKATIADVAIAFRKANEARAKEVALRIPGREAVRTAIGRLSKAHVMFSRYGREEAAKRLRPVGRGLVIERPLQRVEMDEWKINLMSIIHSAGLQTVFGEEFLKSVGLDDETSRWWLVAAIDCRTRIILGMKLTRDPTTSAAQNCLRMVLSDKGQWADAVGAQTPWSQCGVPELLVTDNGSAFKAHLFSSCCAAIGSTLLRTIAGAASMRGTIERFFQTGAINLLPRLKGRTFANVLERGTYPSEKRACLDVDDLCFALVRWIVDIYHNSPHEGLGGRTPLEQWEADMAAGNFPKYSAPDSRTRRLAFGVHTIRKVRESGITVLGVRYNSDTLAAWCLVHGSKDLDLRWDGEDIGAIEVCLDGEWHEVPSVFDRFEGLNAQVWMKVRRDLRAKSPGRKQWDEDTVLKAIDDIEAMSAQKSLAFGIVDTTMTPTQLVTFEKSLFDSFEVSGSRMTRPDTAGLGRRINPRQPDPDLLPNSRRSASKPVATTAVSKAARKPAPQQAQGNPAPTPAKAPPSGKPRWTLQANPDSK